MERLDFTLPEFVRKSWVSDQAQQTWEPRIQRIIHAWHEIEWRSVLASIRRCAVSIASPEQFVQRAGEWARQGLTALPVEIIEASGLSYSARGRPAEPGQPFAFRLIIGSLQAISEFQQAWDACDHLAMGALLGYPECCTRFFQDVWIEQGLNDTTWPMAAGTAGHAASDHTLEVNGFPEANILWRWMGLRLAPHLPCSFDCAPSREFARQLAGLGRASGFTQEMDWLTEILSWPAEWSALHGIAEIKTPIVRLSTQTDATPVRYIVRRLGQAYPAEGAPGIAFPYNQAPRRRRRARPAAALAEDAQSAADNGFPSLALMDAAHAPVVQAALAVLGTEGGAVLDLGCGNGALLQKLHQANPAIEPFGIDRDPERIERARRRWPEFADHFAIGDIFSSAWPWAAERLGERCYDLILLYPGRLLEAAPETTLALRSALAERSKRILVYSYDDGLNRYGSLDALCRAASLPGVASLRLLESAPSAVVGLAVLA